MRSCALTAETSTGASAGTAASNRGKSARTAGDVARAKLPPCSARHYSPEGWDPGRAGPPGAARGEGEWPLWRAPLPVKLPGAAMATQDALSVGGVVAETYRVTHLLGRGGMGAVWAAEHLRLPGREVAVKVLLAPGVASGEALARFRREAEIASR